MFLSEAYNSWSLGRQLQVSFILSAFILSALLVCITKLQLDWVQSQAVNNTDTVTLNNLYSSMSDLGFLESKFISTEFQKYIATVRNLESMDSVVLGFSIYNASGVVTTQAPVEASNYIKGQSDYTTGAYISGFATTAAGTQLQIKDTQMDKIYPFIFDMEYIGYKQGYAVDAISHYYPGEFTASGYNPLIREWYYRAAYQPGLLAISQPYIETRTNMLVITVSIAILDDSEEVFGVAATTIPLKVLQNMVNKIKVLETGFAVLISAEGMALTLPPVWSTNLKSYATYRIYDIPTIGISFNEWKDIENLDEDQPYLFNDTNGEVYILKKYYITPFIGSSNVSHYLLLCANLSEAHSNTQATQNMFAYTYNWIFYVTLGIGIFVLISITLLIKLSTMKISNQLKMVEQLFSKLVRRGLFPKLTVKVSCKKLKDNSQEIESLVDACKLRIDKMNALDNKFRHINVGFTRPADELIFNELTSCLYPYNLYANRQMKWKGVLSSLPKHASDYKLALSKNSY